MSNGKGDRKNTATLNLVSISDGTRQVSAEMVSLLEQLIEEARTGAITGIASVVLRPNGGYELHLRGDASHCANNMAVAGMLAALQKMVLELDEFGTP